MKSTTYRIKYTKKLIIKINNAQISDKNAYNLKKTYTTLKLKLSDSFFKKEKEKFRF